MLPPPPKPIPPPVIYFKFYRIFIQKRGLIICRDIGILSYQKDPVPLLENYAMAPPPLSYCKRGKDAHSVDKTAESQHTAGKDSRDRNSLGNSHTLGTPLAV